MSGFVHAPTPAGGAVVCGNAGTMDGRRVARGRGRGVVKLRKRTKWRRDRRASPVPHPRLHRGPTSRGRGRGKFAGAVDARCPTLRARGGARTPACGRRRLAFRAMSRTGARHRIAVRRVVRRTSLRRAQQHRPQIGQHRAQPGDEPRQQPEQPFQRLKQRAHGRGRGLRLGAGQRGGWVVLNDVIDNYCVYENQAFHGKFSALMPWLRHRVARPAGPW